MKLQHWSWYLKFKKKDMKNAGVISLRVLLGLLGLTLLVNGFMWAFLPETNMETDGIIANSVLGLNMIKSDIGAPLMAVGLFQLLFVLGRNEFFLPLVIIASSYFVVRTVSFFVDGSHLLIIIGIVMELLVPVLNMALYRLRKS